MVSGSLIFIKIMLIFEKVGSKFKWIVFDIDGIFWSLLVFVEICGFEFYLGL